ncbi:hypothetical protein, conserved in T.vivax [Trypanosoma vivax Y486]|uniref:Uncharacterized protein n=1 Tax=Trypanosoma vivax (strain Y486) TaxID=1055687 RepID=F9WRT4_TRYVY|nr:hypothetical protein, conserved in T.vivax [Trypanosoma vivax Y486]|eukprot:CCD20268.1 hypothetical protein, conserved in T.vivax [Trypanosoma vivax Y486]
MLFLLFLFLGTLGAQAEAKQAVCNFKRGEGLNCNITECLGEQYYTYDTRDNVTCICEDHRQAANYMIEFHGISTGDTCFLTASEDAISCREKKGQNCIEKCNGAQSGKIVLHLECSCKRTEDTQTQDNKAEGAQNQGKKAEGAQNQGKKAEGAQNQGKKAEGAQNQGKKAEGTQNQGNGNSEKPGPHESTGTQNSDQLGEPSGTENGTGVSSAPGGIAEQSTQFEKMKGGVSAAVRNSQEVAYLYPLLPFIAAMPRHN